MANSVDEIYVLELLPLEIWYQIGTYDPTIWRNLALAVPELGRYSLLREVQDRLRERWPIVLKSYDTTNYLIRTEASPMRIARDLAECFYVGRSDYDLTGRLCTNRTILHRFDGPARYTDDNGVRTHEVWSVRGRRNRLDGPAERKWKYHEDTDPMIELEVWAIHGKLHREDGPAVIKREVRNNKPVVTHEAWYQMGNLHRLDGPAETRLDYKTYCVEKAVRWYRHGNLHRGDGPAESIETKYMNATYHTYHWYHDGKKFNPNGENVNSTTPNKELLYTKLTSIIESISTYTYEYTCRIGGRPQVYYEYHKCILPDDRELHRHVYYDDDGKIHRDEGPAEDGWRGGTLDNFDGDHWLYTRTYLHNGEAVARPGILRIELTSRDSYVRSCRDCGGYFSGVCINCNPRSARVGTLEVLYRLTPADRWSYCDDDQALSLTYYCDWDLIDGEQVDQLELVLASPYESIGASSSTSHSTPSRMISLEEMDLSPLRLKSISHCSNLSYDVSLNEDPPELSPSYIAYDKRGDKLIEAYQLDHKLHRINGPALIVYKSLVGLNLCNEDGGEIQYQVQESWYHSGRAHRLYGPAKCIWYPLTASSTLYIELWYVLGQPHRLNSDDNSPTCGFYHIDRELEEARQVDPKDMIPIELRWYRRGTHLRSQRFEKESTLDLSDYQLNLDAWIDHCELKFF